MGLFDNLPTWLPEDPAKNTAARAGLLNLGAALMGGRGNIGSILGGGLMAGAQGYNGSLVQQQQSALAAAQQRRLDLDNLETQAKIDEPARLARLSAEYEAQQRGAGPDQVLPLTSLPQTTPAPDAGAPLTMIPQASTPRVQSLGALPRLGQGAPAAGSPIVAASPSDQYKDAMMRAQFFSTRAPAQAKIYLDIAEKLRPKVKETRALTVDGKRVMANVFEDGTTRAIDGFAPDAEKLSFQNTGGSTVALDPYTGKPVNTIQNTQSPDSVASNATQRRGQDMQHQDSDPQAPITDAAILNAAARYNLDGTLPPMGMGKNAAAGRSAILNKAAELAAGVDPEQQRRDQLAFKGDVASQSAAVKAFTSGKQGNAVRSFNVALSHLDTLGRLADALHNGDTQAFNKLGNAIAAQTGKAAPTSFEAVKHIVGDEIVKAVTGSAGALGDREAAAKTIDAANSPAQLKAVMDNYRELMRGQLDGLHQQYETSTGRKDFDRFLSQSAKSGHSVAPLANLPKKVSAPGGHPADITNLLNKYGSR
jgi:hypothetical protein